MWRRWIEIHGVQSFINKIDERFKRPAKEIAMQRIAQRNDIKRRSNEGFGEFWCRFERLTNRLAALGINWPGKVLLRKAFVAANMAEDQKSLIRATLELNPGNESVVELRRFGRENVRQCNTSFRRSLQQ